MTFLRDIGVAKKRVLVRVDFNVALDGQGKIMDDFRIRSTLPTLQHLLGQQAKIILLAHLGRPKPAERSKYSLAPLVPKLEKLLERKIILAPDCVGESVNRLVSAMKEGDILMLENLRWHAEEEANDENFARQLASLGEVYVNDAFAVSHRAHASVEAITRFLPSVAGFLLEKEVVNLSRALDNPDHPLCVILGGAKISTKIKLIQNFLGKAEDIVLGGALANTVLHAKGIAMGRSLIEEDMIGEVAKLEITNTKLHLPVDAVLCDNHSGAGSCRTGPVGNIKANESLLDIGPDSEELFAQVIKGAKMIIWNGVVGFYEVANFCHGTQAIAQSIAQTTNAFSIVGGGETVAYLEQAGLLDRFNFVSTGGGAMMEFLAGESLPGIEALNAYQPDR